MCEQRRWRSLCTPQNSETTLNLNARTRLTADSTTHSDAMLGWHACVSTGRSRQPRRICSSRAERRWTKSGLRLTCTKTNDNGEKVVREAIIDLAINFPVQLCTHLVDVSLRAPVAERYTTSAKKVATCAKMVRGRGGQVETPQGRGAPGGHGDVWEAGPRVGESAQPVGDGNGPHGEVETGAAGAEQTSGAGGTRVSRVPVRVHPDSLSFLRELCACHDGSQCSDFSC